jgi:tRNA G26 N,N-dimethylase Trm1
MLEQYVEFSRRFKIDQKLREQGSEAEQSLNAAQGDYSTAGANAEALNREKLKQRRALAKHVEDDDGTVIEMFGGRGNLTNAVWKAHSSRNILVEYNKETVEQFTQNITDETRTTIYQMSNLDFASQFLKDIEPKTITAIDFDAFGSVIPIVTRTLENFKPIRPLVVGITDGIGSNLVRISRQKDELLNRLTELIAKDHGLSCEKINGTHNRKSTVYCGYVFKPL